MMRVEQMLKKCILYCIPQSIAMPMGLIPPAALTPVCQDKYVPAHLSFNTQINGCVMVLKVTLALPRSVPDTWKQPTHERKPAFYAKYYTMKGARSGELGHYYILCAHHAVTYVYEQHYTFCTHHAVTHTLLHIVHPSCSNVCVRTALHILHPSCSNAYTTIYCAPIMQ